MWIMQDFCWTISRRVPEAVFDEVDRSPFLHDFNTLKHLQSRSDLKRLPYNLAGIWYTERKLLWFGCCNHSAFKRFYLSAPGLVTAFIKDQNRTTTPSITERILQMVSKSPLRWKG